MPNYEAFLSAERLQRLREILEQRTRNVTVVLEDLFHYFNGSAIIRTCEAFGIQDLHVIEASEKFWYLRGLTQGAEKWLTIQVYSAMTACLEHLKKQGYTLWAGALDANCELGQVDFSGKVALVFGNERRGISAKLRQLVDQTYKIPMLGFSQSINVSAAVAVTLHTAWQYRMARNGRYGDLSETEKKELWALWVKKSVKYISRERLHDFDYRNLKGPWVRK